MRSLPGLISGLLASAAMVGGIASFAAVAGNGHDTMRFQHRTPGLDAPVAPLVLPRPVEAGPAGVVGTDADAARSTPTSPSRLLYGAPDPRPARPVAPPAA